MNPVVALNSALRFIKHLAIKGRRLNQYQLLNINICNPFFSLLFNVHCSSFIAPQLLKLLDGKEAEGLTNKGGLSYIG